MDASMDTVATQLYIKGASWRGVSIEFTGTGITQACDRLLDYDNSQFRCLQHVCPNVSAPTSRFTSPTAEWCHTHRSDWPGLRKGKPSIKPFETEGYGSHPGSPFPNPPKPPTQAQRTPSGPR